MAKVLIGGSTGFIGRRLTFQLLQEGHEVYAVSRMRGIELKAKPEAKLYTVFGDMRDGTHMEPFPTDLDAAYYLVHSLALDSPDIKAEEENCARNFLAALEKTQCKQIIFLGGIIENKEKLSPHLRSRLAVEDILKKGSIPCTILRSSIIIGAGSASFEIIRDLVEKLPVMVAPRWVKSLCQPISVKDVLFYLSGVLLKEATFNQTYDIGGPDVLSFKEVLLQYASFRKLKRRIIDVPLLTPRLSSYWLVFITSVRYSICAYLVESMRQNTRKLNHAIDKILPHPCLSYEESLRRAFQKISQNEVISTWMDAWDLKTLNADVHQFIEVPEEGCLKDVQVVPILSTLEEAKNRVWSIGGDEGWFAMNWAWKLRGLLDKLVGGIGLNRGRRHPTEIDVGDSIDFWRVLMADKQNGHLILFAEMKVPGEAWLEFKIDKEKKVLTQTATFRPKGVIGRLYWYSLLPFHFFIFKKMAKSLAGDLV